MTLLAFLATVARREPRSESRPRFPWAGIAVFVVLLAAFFERVIGT